MDTRIAAIALALLLATVAGVLLGAFVYVCIHMPGQTVTGKLPPLDPAQARLRDRLKEHVRFLAVDMGERNAWHITRLNQTADYIRDQFRSLGYTPVTREFGDKHFRNISVEIHGDRQPGRIIVVGAHYDTVTGTPGADDNASGVAGLLEIARALAGRRFPLTVRLIAFCNEEEPFYGTDQMGSRVSVEHSRDLNEDIVAMFSLEMIGYYVDEPGSQRYPRIVRRFYPDRGNFIAFVSNLASRDVLHRAIAAFREQGVFPSEGMAAPESLVPDIRRSDHAMYWYFGYPAVMVTDTSNFRNYGYHNMGDSYQSLNYDAMARVVDGLTGMIRDLAGGNEE